MSQTHVPRDFKLTSERHGATAVIRLAGEFDIACEECFEAALRPLAEQHDSIIIDLRSLSFVDSTGLRMLIAAHERSRLDDFRLSVVAGDGQVRRTLELTGLDHVLPIVEHNFALIF